jgi:hypothetical protein
MGSPGDTPPLDEFPHGVITFEQLKDAGVTKSGIQKRVRSKRIHRIHPGVFAIGRKELSQRGLWLAAVLSYPDAVLSHRSAAELWGLVPEAGGPIHVAVAGRGGKRPRDGVIVHRLPSLKSADRTIRDHIPVTTPARTLHDLAFTDPPREVKRARRQAEFRRYAIKRSPDDDGTASDGEVDFLAFCRRHGLPMPEVNVRVGPFVADFLWREKRLIVEMDDYSTHGSELMFSEDRSRDLDLRGRGYEVLRLTVAQLRAEPAKVAAILRARLG